VTNALPGGGRLRVLITNEKRTRLENLAQVAAEFDWLPDSNALMFTGLGATASVQVPAHGPDGRAAGGKTGRAPSFPLSRSARAALQSSRV
jgi:hypothetical protein